ncbi:MAG: phosphotransferase [Elusimicrobia bacterium]|nr:phosphotransferase [Elusimicrobiota bacterium]
MEEEAQKRLQALYRAHFGAAPKSIAPLKAHASSRLIYRLGGGKKTVIGVHNDDPQENAAFIEFSRHFRECGLPVPAIYASDAEKDVYLEQDLGDVTLFDLLSKKRTAAGFPKDVIDVYKQAVKILPKFQVEAGKTLDYGFCYPRASFDKKSMMWDLNYFKYYFLRLANTAFDEQALEDDFEAFSDYLLDAPRDFFLYRDFQSRNIMVMGGRPWFIDYQGGRKGALQYDIASLLFDAKADIPFATREDLLAYYVEEAHKHVRFDKRKFLDHYHGFVFIRIMQALGTYGLRGFYERKTHFLQSIPYAIRNLEYLLRTSHLPVKVPALMGVFKALVGSSYLRQFGAAQLKLTVRLQSFSFRDALPVDEHGHGGGFVFDCRALPNPGRIEKYAKLTGKDAPVAAFLKKEAPVKRYLDHAGALIESSVANYRGRNFSDLMVSFGCTGGRHRSVYCAEALAKRLRDVPGVSVELRHLALEKLADSTT